MANQLYQGYLFDDSGAAIVGATVELFDRNTTTPVRASTTTDANGLWTISHATEGRFDVRITNGTSKRFRKYDDQIQVDTLEVANLRVRNPADTFEYDIVPAAITADRQLNLPLITGTDTLAVLGLAQTFTAIQTLAANLVFSGSRSIVTNTADASDNANLSIGAGGTAGNDRGASITLSGNEHAQTGRVDIEAGNVAGGVINFTTGTIIRGTIDVGLVLGSPTGGDKGAGTLNAVAVYDDNVLLTDYVLDAWLDSAIAIDSYDAAIPRKSPEDLSPQRLHQPARAFAAVMADRLDPDKLTAYLATHRHLPALPSRADILSDGQPSVGSIAQKVTETLELAFVHILKQHARIKALEAKP